MVVCAETVAIRGIVFFPPSQLSVEILMRGIGVGSLEKLAAAHLNDHRTIYGQPSVLFEVKKTVPRGAAFIHLMPQKTYFLKAPGYLSL